MILLILPIFILLSLAESQISEDTPYTNFSWEGTLLDGPCIYVPSVRVSKKKDIYEGRWYVNSIGMAAEKAKRISCWSFDTYFDTEGRFHNHNYITENGEFKLLITEGWPLNAKEGIYNFTTGNNNYLTNTFFYIDKELYVWWELQCFDNRTRIQEAVIGYRDLKDVPKKAALLNKLLEVDLVKRGGFTERHTLNHENCHYPPKTTNPYL